MTVLDHVALVVKRLEPVLARLTALDLNIGPIEDFPGEGTREVYVGAGAGRLLLMQPTSSEGPYRRALTKRGAGLHHVALNAPDLGAFLANVRGWLLLPVSLQTIDQSRTAWLARPGVPTLLEVTEGKSPQGEPVLGPGYPTVDRSDRGTASLRSAAPVVSAIEVPAELSALVPSAGLSPSTDDRAWLTVGGTRLSIAELTAD